MRVDIVRHLNRIEVSQWATICSLLEIDYRIIDYSNLKEHYKIPIILDTSAPCSLDIMNFKGIFCLQTHSFLKDSEIPIHNIDVVSRNPLFKNIYFRDKLSITPTTKYIDPDCCQEVLADCRYQPIIVSNESTILSSFSIGKTLASKDIDKDYYVFLYFAQNLVEHVLKKEISDKTKVKILLSFDTEGYTNLSNKALSMILDCLDKKGIKGCFNIVGKKIEYIESTSPSLLKRLKNHFISYHTYSHSEHPTLAEYTKVDSGEIIEVLQNLSKTEMQGINLIKETFKKDYLGFAFPGDVYVPYLPIFICRENNYPFLLYSPLNLFGYHVLCGTLDLGPAHIDLDLYLSKSSPPLYMELLRLWSQKIAGGGGLLILRIHPDRLLQKGSWDLQEKSSLEKRPEEEVLQIFEKLYSIVDFFKKLPSTEFICLERFIENTKESPFTIKKEEIIDLISLITNGYYTRIVHGYPFSLLDVLFVVSTCFQSALENQCIPETITIKSLNIAPRRLDFNTPIEVKNEDLITINNKIRNCFSNDEFLPAAFRIENGSIGLPMSLLGLAKAVKIYIETKDFPLLIQIEDTFPIQKWVDKAIMKFPYMWKWPILPKGFNATEHAIYSRSQFFWSVKSILVKKDSSLT